MATLKYGYGTAANAALIYTTNWRAQTFTTDTSDLTIVKTLGIFTNKASSPTGTFTISLRAVDGSNHPTGSDLCVATTDTSTISASQHWLELDVSVPFKMSKSTRYAVVVRNSGGSAGAYTTFYYSASDLYANGNYESSTNSGSTWSANASDGAFRVYCELDAPGGSPMLFGGGVTIG